MSDKKIIGYIGAFLSISVVAQLINHLLILPMNRFHKIELYYADGYKTGQQDYNNALNYTNPYVATRAQLERFDSSGATIDITTGVVFNILLVLCAIGFWKCYTVPSYSRSSSVFRETIGFLVAIIFGLPNMIRDKDVLVQNNKAYGYFQAFTETCQSSPQSVCLSDALLAGPGFTLSSEAVSTRYLFLLFACATSIFLITKYGFSLKPFMAESVVIDSGTISIADRLEIANLQKIDRFLSLSQPSLSTEELSLYEQHHEAVETSYEDLKCKILHELIKMPVKISGIYGGRTISQYYEWEAIRQHLVHAITHYYTHRDEMPADRRLRIREPYSGVSVLTLNDLYIGHDPALQSHIFNLLRTTPAPDPVTPEPTDITRLLAQQTRQRTAMVLARFHGRSARAPHIEEVSDQEGSSTGISLRDV